jgi:hypothetical protein
MFLVLCTASTAFPATSYDVTIDTSGVRGTAGKLAFDFTSNNIGTNHVDILNFSTDGTLGLPETEGGLVEGDIILGANPAHHTRIHDGFFFNELIVNFTSFGRTITFTVQLTETASPAGQLPDEFALFLLDTSYRPLFATSDPSGADALFSICVTGAAGGDLGIFGPTTFQPPSTIRIIIPGAFDFCLQDASNGNSIRINSMTGDYEFKNCRKGLTLTGRGTVTINFCKFTLRDSGPDPRRPDRNVSVLVNPCSRQGDASIRIFSTGSMNTITDSDITNSICSCP